jgi:hypothetical protein
LQGDLEGPVRAEPVTDYVITPHARHEMERRGLDAELVRAVLTDPGQRLAARPGRVILQSRVLDSLTSREYLVRVFVDVNRQPAEVVTAYRTSRVAKYWRE